MLSALLALAAPRLRADYDSLAVPAGKAARLELEVRDDRRTRAAPVVPLGHGLGGARRANTWASTRPRAGT